MNHPKRGTAVIFNHVNFSLPECSKRDGSDKDRDALTDVLHELDFDVIVHNDLTANEVLDVLVTVSQMDHTDADCLVIAVMSHGDDGKVYARDRDYPTKTLWKYFNACICPSLAGKPKLFFVQACRGRGLHSSQTLRYKPETDGYSDDAYYSIPIMADILVMYSTVDGFYSWRDPSSGGYFIQSLVKQLRLHHETKDLLTILTFVNREVAVDFTSYEPKNPKFSGRKQMCSIVSMLTRLLYFTNNKTIT
ncbi:Peptidase C14 domain containing protein [Asbolus verrucosus]|uniref:Peptidase C14 domain containing protein n=1 Tax=Asbolus verrucosus TaxID=1661398 RepID=A0A482VT55_ASBVE|nr:Peptidase C14 domain containing protein [Asbolus verrucosus]